MPKGREVSGIVLKHSGPPCPHPGSRPLPPEAPPDGAFSAGSSAMATFALGHQPRSPMSSGVAATLLAEHDEDATLLERSKMMGRMQPRCPKHQVTQSDVAAPNRSQDREQSGRGNASGRSRAPGGAATTTLEGPDLLVITHAPDGAPGTLPPGRQVAEQVPSFTKSTNDPGLALARPWASWP